MKEELPERHIRPGLCSVTFRDLSAEQIVKQCVDASLACIEWGSDVHVPVGQLQTAITVRQLTQDAGLYIASYGSYLNFSNDNQPVLNVIETAAALGAPRIRVWAGAASSEETTPDARQQINRRLYHAAEMAADKGIELGLEWHGGTLTDNIDSTLRLLDDVDHSNLLTYWQPHQGMPAPEVLETLERVLDRVSTVHVFSWWPTYERHPLNERAPLWRSVFALLAQSNRTHDALLEFVPNDDPNVLPREAQALRNYLEDPV